ncbi:MAG: hypothetical protein ACYDHD_09390 [Vulcanimicrobiaceae bacterium]
MTVLLRRAMLTMGCALICGSVALAAPAPSATPVPLSAAKPIRRLLYSFTYGSSSDLSVHGSGIGASSGGKGPSSGGNASGISRFRAGLSDRGTIGVDVLRVQPDTGLIVRVWEHAWKTRSAAPATCVVYGNTNVICDPTKKVNVEEFTLLRFLGKNFINPVEIGPKGGWKIDNTGPVMSMKNHFRILKNVKGVMQIHETAVLTRKGARPMTATTDGKISYDAPRSVPLSIFEDTITRERKSIRQYEKLTTQIQLNLVHDSMAAVKS